MIHRFRSWAVRGAPIGPAWARALGSPAGLMLAYAGAVLVMWGRVGALRIGVAVVLVVLPLVCRFWLRLDRLREIALRLGLVRDPNEVDAELHTLRAMVYTAEVEHSGRVSAAAGMKAQWLQERGFRRMRRVIVVLLPFLLFDDLPRRYFYVVLMVVALEGIGGVWAEMERVRARPTLWMSPGRILAGVTIAALVVVDPVHGPATGLVDWSRMYEDGWSILVGVGLWIAASSADAAVRYRVHALGLAAEGREPGRWATAAIKSWFTIPTLRNVGFVVLLYVLLIDVNKTCGLDGFGTGCGSTGLRSLRQHLEVLSAQGPGGAFGALVLVALAVASIAGIFTRSAAWKARDEESMTHRRAAAEVADYGYLLMHSRIKPQIDEVVNHLEEQDQMNAAQAQALSPARRAHYLLGKSLRALSPHDADETGLTLSDVLEIAFDNTKLRNWHVVDNAGDLSTFAASDLSLLEFVVSDLTRNANQASAPSPRLEIEVMDVPLSQRRYAAEARRVRVAVTCDCSQGARTAPERGLAPLRRRIEMRGGKLTEGGGRPHITEACWTLSEA